ncbi:TPA: TIM barrel protein [Klebsiella oxytoca]|uniref:TIM barrel protein n=1 Tax=Klebsiella oxytoca TaxID=571 RepID=UPI0027FE368A|nr:TIM barrel protein [Klebsiella oxytoca]HDT4621512.1 TIM barrel protein [Klebsiella oxytoca]
MIEFGAHLGYQFNEAPFKDRFELAHLHGYKNVEFPNPYIIEKEELADLLKMYSLNLVQFATPQGKEGEKGFAAIPGRSVEFRESVDKAIDYAKFLDCKMVHPMSGCESISCRGDWDTYLKNIQLCAEIFSDNNLVVLLEVMSLPTIKGYFLHSYELYSALMSKIPDGSIGLLFDTWHAKVIYDDVMHPLLKFYNSIKHIHISDYPGRHEPGTGNLDFDSIFQFLNDNNYAGVVGCEYEPLTSTEASIEFIKRVKHKFLGRKEESILGGVINP